MAFFLRMLGILLVLLAILSGGCSLVWTPDVFQGGVLEFWLAGIIVAAISALIARALFRSANEMDER